MSAATAGPTQGQPGSPWIIAVAVMLATFMEVLDTTIVTVSLPHMAGNLSATTDEATWVVTSYLVSNAVVLPASAWFSLRFGRKRFLIACIGIFTVASLLCGAAPTLGFLVLARVLQGVGGGALQPLAQAILLESFPPARRGQAMAVYGLGVVVAPVLGPVLGGWITDHYSWRWIFYINIPVGFLAIFMIKRFVHDPPYIRDARPGRMDAVGLGLLVLMFATLQVVLDKGQEVDWFGAVWLRWFVLICVVSSLVFFLRELRVAKPIVNLRVLKNRNFAVSTVLITVMGVIIYSPLTLLPQFLQNLMGYPALNSGMAQAPRGLGALCIMPIVGLLTGRVDNRKLIGGGFLLVGVSTFWLGRINLEIAPGNIMFSNFVQGLGMPMIFVPLSTAAVSRLPNELIGSATGIYNLMRNIGGSLGISLTTTMVARAAQAHQTVLVSHLTPYDPVFTGRLHALQNSLAPALGTVSARAVSEGVIYRSLVQQANVLAYVDNFRWLALLCVTGVALAFLLRRPPAHHHPSAAH
jgi:DHA2 family multidrug resistance protein